MEKFSSALKKSFNKPGNQEDRRLEHQPILAHHNRTSTAPDHCFMSTGTSGDAGDSREVIVKIDAGDQTTATSCRNNLRENSLDFWVDDGNQHRNIEFERGNEAQDPPSRLIGQFLNKHKKAGGELSLDMDMGMMELRRDNNLSPVNNAKDYTNKNNDDYNDNNMISRSKEIKVSFHEPSLDNSGRNMVDDDDAFSSDEDRDCVGDSQTFRHRREYSNSTNNMDANVPNGDDGEVLKCTSMIQRRASGLGRLKTRSRFDDPPEAMDMRSGKMKSGQMRSGMIAKSGMLQKPGDDDEDDPLFDEDIPNEYKKANFDPLTIAQWISLVLIVAALVCTLTIPDLKKKKFRGLSLWKWEVLVLVLICGRLVSGWVIRLAVLIIERNFFMRKRVLYFVYGVRKAVQNCIWLGLVLVAWRSMFDNKVQGNNTFLRFVNKLMLCLLVGIMLWLVKTLMVKILASSFHVSRFFDRIQESLFSQYVIETLSGPSLIELQNQQEEEERTMAEVWKLQNAGATLPQELRLPSFQALKSTRFIGSARLPPKGGKGASFKESVTLPKTQDDQGITIDHLHKLNPKNISAWNMKRLMNIVRHGAISTLDEQLMDSTQGDEATTQIRSEYEAKLAARKIFQNVARPRAKFIYLQDLMRFLREEEAHKAMNLVEGSSESEKITKASLKAWVVNAFRERRALALTLNDTKTAVKKLHHMLNVIVSIVILVISLLILEIASSKFLLFVSSQIVVVAFVFGNTLKTIFEAVIFVFVMHPFDVGDRCEVDGVQMVVEEMNILTTIFLRYDNQKIMYPNTTLATKQIGNYYRSPDMGDSVEFSIHITTPAEKIAIMKQRIVSYIENKKDHWYPSPSVVLMNFDDLHKLKLAVWMRHKMNHQDMGERWKRRALLVDEMSQICKELDIEYRFCPIDINVRALPNSGRTPPGWMSPGN